MVHLPRCLREILVNNLVKKFSCSLLVSIFFISGVASSAQAASETKLCRDTGVAFAFFNGVQTTKPQAEIAKQELKRIHGEQSAQGDGLAFLRCWNEGNFDAIRREWPEAPEAVFVGADPLHPVTPV